MHWKNSCIYKYLLRPNLLCFQGSSASTIHEPERIMNIQILKVDIIALIKLQNKKQKIYKKKQKDNTISIQIKYASRHSSTVDCTILPVTTYINIASNQVSKSW